MARTLPLRAVTATLPGRSSSRPEPSRSGPAQGILSACTHWQHRLSVSPGAALHPVKVFQQVLADELLGRQRDRVATIEAGGAQPGGRLLRGGDEAFEADVTEAVRP